jgi:hypothetical protein
VVEFAGTHEPVRNSLANLTYELKEQPPRTERMQPLKNGRFQLAVPLGAQLRALDVCGHPMMLEGPRVKSNAGSRFRPLRTALDTTLGSDGAELRFEVEPALDFVGVVLDAESRQPLEGADVDVELPVGRHMRVRTGADGKFQLTEPGAGQPMRVRREGYVDGEVLLQPGDFGAPDPGLVVPLGRGLRVSGSVFDEHGAPVSAAALELHLRGIEPNGRALPTNDQRRVRTDARGNFNFENVPRCAQATISEIPIQLRVAKRSRASRELGPLTSDVAGLFLLCRDGATIELRLVRRDGTPVDSTQYYCTSEEPGLLDDYEGYSLVPLRVSVRLVAFAREREDDPQHLLVGRSTLHLESGQDPPPVVRIVLEEHLDVTPPSSNAPEVVAYDKGVLATLDLRLVDCAGKPFPAGTRIDFRLGNRLFSQLELADSELRLRCRPSRAAMRARVQIGEQGRWFDLLVPKPGYTRTEQRVWILP